MTGPPEGEGTLLSSPRLVLEPLRVEHAIELYEALHDPRVYSFLPQDPPASPEALAAQYRRMLGGPEPGRAEIWLNWAVRVRANARAIGTVQATIQPSVQNAFVAYLLGPAFWGQGYAREAVRALLHWLRARPDVRTVEAIIDRRNTRSVALVRHLGFELVASVEKAEFFKGAWSDEDRYRLVVR